MVLPACQDGGPGFDERHLPWDGGIRRLLRAMTYAIRQQGFPARGASSSMPSCTPRQSRTPARRYTSISGPPIAETARTFIILEWIVFRPLVSSAAAIADACAEMHHGRLNAYVAYVLITLMGILLLS
jgi:hypothetical protein